MHFDEGLSARHKGGESTKLVTKGLRGKSASEKLSEEGLVKFSTRVSIQVIPMIQLTEDLPLLYGQYHIFEKHANIREFQVVNMFVLESFDFAWHHLLF
jgi:zinc finger FYVE domain-containing protein 26